MLSLALLTDVKVWSNTTFVSDSLDRSAFTNVTNNVVMNFSLLVSCSLSKVFNHQPLKSLGRVRLNLFSQDLLEVIEEFAFQVAGTIAFPARKTLFIHLSSVTLEANN